MRVNFLKHVSCVLIICILSACGTRANPTPNISTPTAVPATPTSAPPTATTTPTEIPLPSLSISFGQGEQAKGITLDKGGDVDTTLVTVGDPPTAVRSSGNNQVLSKGGDTTPDSYLQFNVDDKQLSNGKPTAHVRVEVDYFDSGEDSFTLQYDGLSGMFAGGGSVTKTNTDTFKTVTFNLCDANFANRDNGSDFRISDNTDGAEFIRSVRVIGLPPSGAKTVKVDDFGANPFDDQPDSDAIQMVLDSTCSRDTIVFTSGVNDPGYKGYLIDKTLFLTGMTAKHDLTFTSSDPNNHALLRATADLKGFVVQLYARSRFSNAGDIDNIDFGYVDVDGNRDQRLGTGPNGKPDGIDDNYGSWLPECSSAGDPWCNPGNIALQGGLGDWNDPSKDYQRYPTLWTTGINVHDLVNRQTESGTALAFFSAAGTIQNVTIDTSGEHSHVSGCGYTDNDGDKNAFGDGISLFGPAHTVSNNTIINPSDVAIAYFGGKDTVISKNIIKITQGNYGAFGGINIHTWIFADISGVQVIGNQVTSEGDPQCGGLHDGINFGPHMWGGGYVKTSYGAAFGNNGGSSEEPSEADVAPCTGGPCQIWASVPVGGAITMADNIVSGAQINYLIEGVVLQGRFIDQNNISQSPQLSDWEAAKKGCNGVTWGALDKVAHHPSLPGYTDLRIHCER